MLAAVPSSTVLGVDGYSVVVEIHTSDGLPGCAIVGLPDAACREARDRVRSALLSSGIPFPQQRITINLAPSNVRKTGSAFDLAIAVGLLVTSGKVRPDAVEDFGFIGELGLDGSVRAVDGIVPLVNAVRARSVVVPASLVHQAAVCGNDIRGVATLADLVDILNGDGSWIRPEHIALREPLNEPDLIDVRGQPMARWALEVAAAGGHNLLMTGPPGSGKTMLARRLPALLPDLDEQTAAVATRVHSAAGLLTSERPLVWRPPFRDPHHTSTRQAIVGGGSQSIRPGEASLAHGGVLFLDEMAEFPRQVLDTLRQPLESGELVIARAYATARLPARFLLIGAMNPCPCGEGMAPGQCRCSDVTRNRYLSRLSGPLLDRFDVRVNVMRPRPDAFFELADSEPSHRVAERVAVARDRALQRNVRCNADLAPAELDRYAPLSRVASSLLRKQMRYGLLSGRGFHRIVRVALTLSDLRKPDAPIDAEIEEEDVCAALELRPEKQFVEMVS